MVAEVFLISNIISNGPIGLKKLLKIEPKNAAACTAPKFYIFTEANMCMNCSVQCVAQRRHQTISMWDKSCKKLAKI